MKRFSIIVAACCLLFVGACGDDDSGNGSTTSTTGGSTTGSADTGAALPQGSEPVKLDPADFTTEIDNPYWPISKGKRWVYRNAGGAHRRDPHEPEEDGRRGSRRSS